MFFFCTGKSGSGGRENKTGRDNKKKEMELRIKIEEKEKRELEEGVEEPAHLPPEPEQDTNNK